MGSLERGPEHGGVAGLAAIDQGKHSQGHAYRFGEEVSCHSAALGGVLEDCGDVAEIEPVAQRGAEVALAMHGVASYRLHAGAGAGLAQPKEARDDRWVGCGQVP